MDALKRPSIYDYLNYRDYLRELIDYLRAKGEYSVRSFARKSKLRSSNYLYMVISGQRNISEKTAKQISRGFELSHNEQEYFIKLVRFNHPKNLVARADELKELLRLQKKLPRRQLEAKQIEALSHWKVAVLLVALTTSFRQLSLSDQAQTLQVSEAQLLRWIEILKEAGFLDSALIPTDRNFEIPDQARDLVLRSLHKQMLQNAIRAADELPVSDRDLSFLTLSLSKDNFSRARQMVADFRAEMTRLFAHDPQAQSVFQMNFQIYPVLSWSSAEHDKINLEKDSKGGP